MCISQSPLFKGVCIWEFFIAINSSKMVTRFMNFHPNLMSNVCLNSNLSMTNSQWRPYTRSSNTLNPQFQALNSFLLYTVDARV